MQTPLRFLGEKYLPKMNIPQVFYRYTPHYIFFGFISNLMTHPLKNPLPVAQKRATGSGRIDRDDYFLILTEFWDSS